MDPTSGIEVTAGYSPIAFMLCITRPRLQLDGYDPVLWRWGSGVLPVSPGRHRLRCWFRWGFFSQAGSGTFDVEVPAGALVRVRYAAPTWFVFSPGRFTQEATVAFPASASATPGWHADPSGRYSFRYWDGSGWTAHVSTNDVVTTDAFT